MPISLGAVLAVERRERRDRREQPRRQSDFSSIAHVARRIDAGHTKLEVMIDAADGMRLVAEFACGCSASEPIGDGTSAVRIASCAQHAVTPPGADRRRSG